MTCVVQNKPLFSFSVWFVYRELSYALIWPSVLCVFVCFCVAGGGGVGWRKVYSCIFAQVALNKFTPLLGCVNVGGREISVCLLSYATFTALYHCYSVSSFGDANKSYYVVVDNFFCTQRNTNNCDWYVLNTSGLIFREDDAKHLATFVNPWQVLCCVTDLTLSVENLRKWHDVIAMNSFPAKAMHPLRVLQDLFSSMMVDSVCCNMTAHRRSCWEWHDENFHVTCLVEDHCACPSQYCAVTSWYGSG